MAKQVQVRYVYNAGALECRDCTVGRVYDAELPSFGEVDKDGAEVQFYDELWITKDDAGDAIVTRLSLGFELVEEQDDPLPPAPESALYNALSDGGCNLEVAMLAANAYYDGRIRISVRNNQGAKQGKVTCLTPDAALQLAHDLNRMANEIKRRERAQSGE